MVKAKEKNTNVISPVNVADRQAINISAGDTVRVWIKVEEKGKTRLQPFEGLVLARKHGSEAGATFTVRRVSSGVGVEKIFPLFSPNIDKIEILKRAKTRRAKLYHIRDKAARQVKRQMRRAQFVDISTESDMESKAQKEKEEDPKAPADPKHSPKDFEEYRASDDARASETGEKLEEKAESTKEEVPTESEGKKQEEPKEENTKEKKEE